MLSSFARSDNCIIWHFIKICLTYLKPSFPSLFLFLYKLEPLKFPLLGQDFILKLETLNLFLNFVLFLLFRFVHLIWLSFPSHLVLFLYLIFHFSASVAFPEPEANLCRAMSLAFTLFGTQLASTRGEIVANMGTVCEQDLSADMMACGPVSLQECSLYHLYQQRWVVGHREGDTLGYRQKIPLKKPKWCHMLSRLMRVLYL